MTTQTRVRAHDPLSSVIAAERAALFAGAHRSRIKAALQHGWATAAEIARATGLTVVQVDRRLPEIQCEGGAEVVQVEGADLIRDGFRVWRAK